MKKIYVQPITEIIHIEVRQTVLVGSLLDHADSKRRDFEIEGTINNDVGEDRLPHYSAWDEQ